MWFTVIKIKRVIVFTRECFYFAENVFAATIDGTYFSKTFDEKVLAIHSTLTCLLRDFNFSNTFIITAAKFSFLTGKYGTKKRGDCFLEKGVDSCHVGRWENYITWNTIGEVASKFHFCVMFMSLSLKLALVWPGLHHPGIPFEIIHLVGTQNFPKN